MKSASLGRFVFSLLLCLAVSLAHAQDDAAPPPVPISTQASELYSQVRSIANARAMSRRKKEQWISNAVRVSVIAATAYDGGSEEALAIASRLAASAARGAPAYADSIAKAAAYAPTIVRIEGAVSRIRASTLAAARARPVPMSLPTREVAAARPARRRPPPPDADADSELASAEPAPMPAATESRTARRHRPAPPPDEDNSVATGDESAAPMDSVPTDAVVAEDDDNPPPARSHHVDLNSNSALHATLDTTVEYNDNIYLTPTTQIVTPTGKTVTQGPTRDTIYSVTPGVQAGFGEHSVAQGGVFAKESFTHYQQHSSPNAHLADVGAQFHYDGDVIKTSASGTFQQTYQNTPEFGATGQRELLRTDMTNVGGSFESEITAKTGGRIGFDFNRVDYKAPSLVNGDPRFQLVGNRVADVPASLLYKPDPNLNVSTGVTFSQTTPTGNGPKSKDFYYNIGADGVFTEKLTGNFSVGYRTRRVDEILNGVPVPKQNDQEHLLGFNGGFTYKATEKTSAALTASRNFNSSDFGQSTKVTSYGLQLTTNFTPQFSVTAGTAYHDTSYGPAVFVDQSILSPLAVSRVDHSWDANLGLSYTFTTWCSASANYVFHNNRSAYSVVTTQTVPDYTNNIFSLTLGLQY